MACMNGLDNTLVLTTEPGLKYKADCLPQDANLGAGFTSAFSGLDVVIQLELDVWLVRKKCSQLLIY